MSPSDRQAYEQATVQRFLSEFDQFVSKVEANNQITEYDFRGFRFPAVEFKTRQFRKKPVFEDCVFNQNIVFKSCTFSQWTTFASATFNGTTSFHSCHFDEGVDFTDAQFNSDVEFRDSEFGMLGAIDDANKGRKVDYCARFLNVTFDKQLFFQDSQFHFGASFSLSKFNNFASFYYTTFSRKADFVGAAIHREVRFMGPDKASVFLGPVDFCRLRIAKDALLSFENICLSKASFLHTNVEHIAFKHVGWRCVKDRRVLNDEAALSPTAGEDDYETVAENYRQLVLNSERRRDFESAEDFHIGEMEMRRRKLGVKSQQPWGRKTREWFNGYSCYKVLSKYGTSYGRALGWLVIWVSLFSLAFLYTGFQPVNDSGSIGQLIEYNLWSDATHKLVSWPQWCSDFLKSVELTGSILTFQKERFYAPANWLSRLWLCLAVVVLTSQTALVLLAIRRRFKR